MLTRIILILTLILSVLLGKESYFKIDGMVCETGCAYKIKTIVDAIDGIEKSNVDFNKKILFVYYDEKMVSDKIILDAIHAQTTFKAFRVKKKKKEKKKTWLQRLFY